MSGPLQQKGLLYISNKGGGARDRERQRVTLRGGGRVTFLLANQMTSFTAQEFSLSLVLYHSSSLYGLARFFPFSAHNQSIE